MANRWGKMEAVRDYVFLGSKVTADGDCSHEIKSYLAEYSWVEQPKAFEGSLFKKMGRQSSPSDTHMKSGMLTQRMGCI